MNFVFDWFSRVIPMVDHLLRLEGSKSLKHSLSKKQLSDIYISVGKAASFLTNKTCQTDLDNFSQFMLWILNGRSISYCPSRVTTYTNATIEMLAMDITERSAME